MSDETADELVHRLQAVLDVRARRMFGGIGIDHEGVFFALVHGAGLYFRVDDASRAQYERAGSRPFHPFAHKPAMRGYFEVPDTVLRDRASLASWARRALAAARARNAPRGASQPRRRARDAGAVPTEKPLAHLGPAARRSLAGIGIRTHGDLARRGSVATYHALLDSGRKVSLNLLWALEATLLGMRPAQLSPAIRESLLQRARSARAERLVARTSPAKKARPSKSTRRRARPPQRTFKSGK